MVIGTDAEASCTDFTYNQGSAAAEQPRRQEPGRLEPMGGVPNAGPKSERASSHDCGSRVAGREVAGRGETEHDEARGAAGWELKGPWKERNAAVMVQS